MKTAQAAQYIGYYNASDNPVSLMFGGIGAEIAAGYPVTNSDGMLVRNHRTLEQLVAQGLLARIPATHAEFSNWDAKAAQRNSANILPSQRPVPRAPQDQVVASSRGSLQEEPFVEPALPQGATRTVKGGKSVISYDGKTFTSEAALRAYLA